MYLDTAFELMDRFQERFWEADLHRVKGELVVAESKDEAGALACFEKALEVSSGQQAKSLELRAATSPPRVTIVVAPLG